MKGVIFNLVEDAVSAAHGPEAWDAVVDQSGVPGAYTSLGDYPDTELHDLVAAGSDLLATPPDVLTRHVGTVSMSTLATAYPRFFTPHRHVREFLLTLNEVIHPEVRKVHPGADPPHFTFTDLPGGGLRLGYDSPRMLCALAEGMITGSGPYFGQLVTITRPSCRRRGDDVCLLDCDFTDLPGHAI